MSTNEDNTKLTKTQYLYGTDVDPSEWAAMTYPEALQYKAKLAYDRITVLQATNLMERDSNNINACVTAIKFNEALLKEME